MGRQLVQKNNLDVETVSKVHLKSIKHLSIIPPRSISSVKSSKHSSNYESVSVVLESHVGK